MKTYSFHALILIALLLAGCTKEPVPTEKNALLPDRLIVFSPVPFSDHIFEQPTDFQSISDYNSTLLSKALAGELTVHNTIAYHSDLGKVMEMSMENLINNLDLADSDSNYYPTETERHVREILSGFFVEEWFFNEVEFEFTKSVIQYQPTWHKPYFYDIRSSHEDTPSDTMRILLFGVHTDPPVKPSSVSGNGEYISLVKDFRYELELYNQSFEQVIFSYDEPLIDEDQWTYSNFMYFKDFDRDRFTELIFDKVMSGQVPAYDPKDLITVMDIPAINSSMLADSIFETYRNEEGAIVTEFREVYLSVENINSVIFVEDWYYNKTSMAIVKVVRAIIPVLHHVSNEWGIPEGKQIKRIPVFAVLVGQDL